MYINSKVYTQNFKSIRPIFSELQAYLWRRLGFELWTLKNFKRVFLKSMFLKSVYTISQKRLHRSVWNFYTIFYIFFSHQSKDLFFGFFFLTL